MSDSRLNTFQDLVEYCQALRHGGARTQEQTDIKAAILGAYNDVPLLKDWPYYHTEYRINLNASYSTGTVAYDHTGGANGERALTITTGTWPSWIGRGRVRFGNYVCEVDRVSSGSASTVLLTEQLNPGADVSSTTFIAYQATYPLPADLVSLEDLMVEQGLWGSYYVSPSEWMANERFAQTSGRTWNFTVMRDPKIVGQWAIYIGPIPNEAEPLGFMYRRRARTMRWAGTESAVRMTASGSAAASTVTTSGTLPASCVGSILRISSSTTESPTSLFGTNPFTEQHEILSISTTTVTLKTSTLGQAFSAGSKIVVTDPVDMSESMVEALKARLEFRMARQYGEKNAMQMLALSDREIRIAMERDSMVRTGISANYVPFSQWARRVGVTTG